MFAARPETREQIRRRKSIARLKHVGRRGFSIVEMIATLILLGVVFGVSISLLAAVARERRSTEQRQYALQYAANLLEHATARGWSELPVGPQEIAAASKDLQALLPELDQQLNVTEGTEDRAKRLTVSIRWKNQQGRIVSPIQLTAWVYPIGEAQP